MPLFTATLISWLPLSMLPSKPFRCSQRHQTHLHFWAGVITKDKKVLKGSKFIHWSLCIWKRELSITPEQRSLISARCKIHAAGKSRNILYFMAPYFPPSSTLQRLDQCSMLSTGDREAWLVFPHNLFQGHRLWAIWGRNSALKSQTSYLGNLLSLHFLNMQVTHLKSLRGIMLEIHPLQKWMYSGGQLETEEVIIFKHGFVFRWNFLNS